MFMLAQIVTRVRNVLIQKIEIFLKTQQEEEIENFTPKYYTLQSSLQI